jgi:hypothetical protein
MFMCATWLFNSAWAGPPFVTDDPEPVEYQHWEVNYALSETWGDGTASAGLPSVDINYGVLPNVQLHVQPRYAYERTTTDRRFGIDDTEVGVKYRFFNVEQDDSTFMIGIYPMHQLPTGDTSLGASRGNGQSFLPIWVQRNTEKWTMYGGTGYRINPGQGNQNSVYVGGTALYQASPSLLIGGEVFHETANLVNGDSATSFNLGGSYNLSRDYNLLFSAGKGLGISTSSNRLSLYSALQVLY